MPLAGLPYDGERSNKNQVACGENRTHTVGVEIQLTDRYTTVASVGSWPPIVTLTTRVLGNSDPVALRHKLVTPRMYKNKDTTVLIRIDRTLTPLPPKTLYHRVSETSENLFKTRKAKETSQRLRLPVHRVSQHGLHKTIHSALHIGLRADYAIHIIYPFYCVPSFSDERIKHDRGLVLVI